MSKKRFIIIALFIACPWALLGTTYIRHDGLWWQRTSGPSRVTFIEGVIHGYIEGYEIGYSGGQVSAAQTHRTKPTEIPESAGFSNNYGFYTQQVTDFYRMNPDLLDETIASLLTNFSDSNRISVSELAGYMRDIKAFKQLDKQHAEGK